MACWPFRFPSNWEWYTFSAYVVILGNVRVIMLSGALLSCQ